MSPDFYATADRSTAWVCGGYEPGSDGVGDYVRRVSTELSGGTGRATVVALADRAVSGPVFISAGLRLPAGAPSNVTVRAAQEFLEERNVGTLAWNFVPQMFAPRGIIPADVARDFATLGRGRRVVLFLHELWAGTGREDTLRNWLTGMLQRPGVLRWCDLHRPDRILTSNEAYAAVLHHHGIAATVVPLCSNIPRRGGVDRAHWPAALAAGELGREDRADWILVGVFGAVHPVWAPGPALAQLEAYATSQRKKVAVVWFGRGSPAADKSWARAAAGGTAHLRFLRLGPLTEATASELLECCDLGLPTIQFNLLGKSGTAAAFTEHGVPLLVVSDAWSPRFAGFTRAPANATVALWGEPAGIDWAGLLAARPIPGSGIQQCLEGWQRALRPGPVLRPGLCGMKSAVTPALILPSR